MSDGSRVYLLGAGFSKHCGLPLARELTEQVWRHFTAEVDKMPAEYQRVLLEWTEFLRQTYPLCDFSSEWPDFEDLITILDEWGQYKADFEGKAKPDVFWTPTHIKWELLKHLAFLLCEKTPAPSDDRLEPVKRFVKKAAEKGHQIISFNWDLVLEAAAFDLELPVSYGGTIKDGLQVAKPHGSFNLAEMPQSEYKFFGSLVNSLSLSLEFEQGDLVVVRVGDPRAAANQTIDRLGRTLLVEPTARKSYQSPWLTLQWRRALKMIRSANEIVVLGFSLPPTDYRPRVLLQLAGIDRAPPRLTLVDPCAGAVAERFAEFVRSPIEKKQVTWTEWFAEIAG